MNVSTRGRTPQSNSFMTDTDGSPPLDPAALALLFERHAGGLGGAIRGLLGRRADVSEVLQEAYVRALRALREGAAPSEPVGWMFVLTLNLCRDLRRKEWRRGPMTALEDVDEARFESPERSPRQALEESEEQDAARAAIHGLEDEIKSVFLLRVSGELPFHE
ncbi:MAG: RNA polymerase sigma factor, partial [Planctomycetota bacterium]